MPAVSRLPEYSDDDLIELGIGLVSDATIAELLGKGRSVVQQRRTAMGIPPFRRHSEHRAPSGTDWDTVVFDDVDRVVAERLGMSVNAVGYQRRARGIAPKRKHRGRRQ